MENYTDKDLPKAYKRDGINEALVKAAKVFLLVYFSDGEKRKPGDLENELLGGVDFNFMFSPGLLPRWNRTPFFYALSELIHEGKISHKELKDGDHVYQNKL